MGILPNQSYASGGSINNSKSISNTYGSAASERAIATTGLTNTSAHNAWEEAAKYNAEQARINREWQERMANSVYQRTVEDMRKAGINPVLAAGMGLGTASVSGGSAASISPSQVYNAQTFADSMSASQSYGSSWNQSENGLITFASALTELGKSIIDNISSSKTIELTIEGLKDYGNYLNETYKDGAAFQRSFKAIGKSAKTVGNTVKKYINMLNPFD